MNNKYFYYEQSCEEAEIDTILDKFAKVADENKTHFFGGGLGRLCMVSDKYADEELPDEIVTLILEISKDPYSFKGVRGYFIDFVQNDIYGNKREKIISEIKKMS